MKKMYRILGLLWILCCFQSVEASHVMGSDMTYRNIDTGVFEIRLVIYRDCEGILVTDDTLFAVSNNKTINMGFPTLVSRTNVTGQRSNCAKVPCSTKGFGVEEWVFLDTIDLSAESACTWRINWSQCCRNGAITTGASGAHFYNELTLDKCLDNSSPIYTQNPVVYLLEGEDVMMNLGVVDTIDGFDSLSFSMISPQIDILTGVPFNSGYSATNPLMYLGYPDVNATYPGGFRLSPYTGDLLFRPTQANQVAIMAIEVKEWLKINGVMTNVGKTRRDIQVIIEPNPGNKMSPYFSNFPTPYASICEGDSLILNLTTADSNSSDSTYISWNSSLPGGVFTTTNDSQQHGSGQLVWVAPFGSARPGPYVVTFTVSDNDCPVSRKSSRSFFVLVNDSTKIPVVDAGPDHFEYTNNLSFRVEGSVPNYPYAPIRWRTNGDGYFADSLATGTLYYPGTQDRLTCSYQLFFEFVNTSTCYFPNGKYSDTLNVIKVYSSPDAGLDQQVFFGDTVFLSGNWSDQRGQKAAWRTAGDGYFGDSLAKQTFYIPGAADWLACTIGIHLETYGTGCSFQSDSITFSRKEGTLYSHPDISALQGDSAGIMMIPDTRFNQQFYFRTLGDGAFSDSVGSQTYYTPGVQDLANCSTQIVVEEYPTNACFVNKDTLLYIKALPIFEAGSNLQLYFGDTAQLNATPQASSNYQFGYWTTAGDGYFTDSTDAQSAYILGTNDWINCGTTLYWNERDQNCGGRMDSIKLLRVSTLVQAGNDQNKFYDPALTYNMQGVSDTANGQFAYWTSNGDGTFNDSFDLNAVYTPGTSDLQNCRVTLKLTGYPAGSCSVFDEMDIQIQDSAVKILQASVDSNTFDTVFVSIYSVTNRANLSWSTNGTGNFISQSATGVAYVLSNSDTNLTNLELIVTNDAPCLTSRDTVRVNPTLVKNPLSNRRNTFQSEVKLYPNPANKLLHLQVSGSINLPSIFDLQGKQLNIPVSFEGEIYTWDISELSPGMYMLMLQDNEGMKKVLRFVVE